LQIGTIGAVLMAQQAPKEDKGTWMFRHKSLGLLSGMIVFPRVAYRVLSMASYRVMPLTGNSALENSLGSFTHKLLYGFMIVMPGE
jgi:cytochrome b561